MISQPGAVNVVSVVSIASLTDLVSALQHLIIHACTRSQTVECPRSTTSNHATPQ